MSTTTQTMAIAETILEQIQFADRSALGLGELQIMLHFKDQKNFKIGLEFQVNGLTHVGWVKVCLRWVDDYTIVFINKNREVVKTTEEIYCDMLVPAIDWIEGK